MGSRSDLAKCACGYVCVLVWVLCVVCCVARVVCSMLCVVCVFCAVRVSCVCVLRGVSWALCVVCCVRSVACCVLATCRIHISGAWGSFCLTVGYGSPTSWPPLISSWCSPGGASGFVMGRSVSAGVLALGFERFCSISTIRVPACSHASATSEAQTDFVHGPQRGAGSFETPPRRFGCNLRRAADSPASGAAGCSAAAGLRRRTQTRCGGFQRSGEFRCAAGCRCNGSHHRRCEFR